MTRDEAIDRVYDIGKAANVTGTAGERMTAAMAQVDALAALGVLKLEDAAAFDKKGMPRQHADAPMPDVKPPAPARCEPPPEHREKRWHWLGTKRSIDRETHYMPAEWLGDQGWSATGKTLTQTQVLNQGWRYVAPCEEPSFLKGSRVRVVRMESGDASLIGKLGTVVMRDDKWCRILLDRESRVRLFPVDCLEELSATQHAKGEPS